MAVGACVLLSAAPGLARHHRSKKSERHGSPTEKAADKRAHKGAVVVVPPDFEPPPAGEQPVTSSSSQSPAEAMAKLEAAYQRSRSPEALFQLGVLAQAQGKTVEAQDFMRRYLADPLLSAASTAGEAASAPDRATAEQILALPRLPSGDVHVIADHEGLLYVDDRLVGTWPLPLPLLVPIGVHVVAIQARGHRQQGKVEVIDGRGTEIRFNRTTSAVLVTVPPAVLVLDELVLSKAQQGLRIKIAQLIEQSLQNARLSSYSKEAALAKQPSLRGCLSETRCQEALAKQADAEYVLRVEVRETPESPTPPGTLSATWSLSLLDVDAGDLAATEAQSCTACTPQALVSGLSKTLRTVSRDGPNRPRGTLAVSSTPPEAEVLIGSRLLGKTPYRRTALTGSYELTVRHPGYAPEKLQAVITPGKTAELAVTLVAQPSLLVASPQPGPQRLPRPRWRLISGGVLLGSGIILSGVGISGLYVNGGCTAAPVPPAVACRERFDTLAPSGAVFGVGAALSIAGAVMLGLPGPRAPTSP